MKKYKNGMSATEVTKRHAGILYRYAKEGHIIVPRWVITSIYDLAEFYGYANKHIAEAEDLVILAVEYAQKGKASAAQDMINEYAETFLITGLPRTSKDFRFVHGQYHSEVLDDLYDD